MEKTDYIPALLKLIETHLLEQGYTENSIKTHKCLWNRLASYAQLKGLSNISRSWVLPYMREHYCDANGKARSNGYRNYIRSAEIICDYAENGYVSRKRRIRRTPVNCATVDRLKAYLHEDLRYSSRLIHDYNYIWDALVFHAADNRYPTFDREWVIPFIKEHYGIEEGKQPTTRRRIQRRAAEMLCDFATEGRFPQRRKELSELPAAYNSLFLALEKYCVAHGLAASTEQTMHYILRQFAAYLSMRQLTLCDLTAMNVREYLISLTGRAKETVSMIHYTLRCVLGTAFDSGTVRTDLSLVCGNIRVPSDAKIPSVFSSKEIQAILNSVDRSTNIGKRDYPILLLASRLGIRVGDIRNLRFKNLCWDTSEICFIQGKTQNEITLPMTEEIGLAIIDYVKHGRPQSDLDFIFLRHKAPFKAFSSTGNLYTMIQKYMNLAGIEISSKKSGMHSLRHSLASNMLSNGVPLPVISQSIGHANTESTKVYIKVDIEQLRKCALSVDVGGRVNG